MPPGIKVDVQMVAARTAFIIMPGATGLEAELLENKHNFASARFLIQFKELSTDMLTSHKDMLIKWNRN